MSRRIADAAVHEPRPAMPIRSGIIHRAHAPTHDTADGAGKRLGSLEPTTPKPADGPAQPRFEFDFSGLPPSRRPARVWPALPLQDGRPLPEAVRGRFEREFQSPLDSIQVHDGAAAAHTTRRNGVQAMAHGEHIYFGRGRYRPYSSAGRRLLAHEITHVIQQRFGGAPALPAELEAEARWMARQTGVAASLPAVRLAAPHPARPLALASAARTAVEDELDDVFFSIENSWPQIRTASQTERNDLANDPVIERNLRRRCNPMELLKTYLLLAHQNENQFPAHYQAFIQATDLAGTHEARIYAILRGVTQTERDDMQAMPGLVDVIEDEMSGSELQQALQLLYGTETHTGTGTSATRSTTHLEEAERYRLNVQATGSFDQASYNLEQSLDEGVESSDDLLADTSLWARFADNFNAEQVWYLRMIARYRSPNTFPELSGNTESFISNIWESVEGGGTNEEQLIDELTNVAAASGASGGGGRALLSPPRLELIDDAWFVPMLESELSGNDLQAAMNAVSASAASAVNIRDALEDAIDDHDMTRIRTLLTSATLSIANRDRLHNDPVILDEMGEELNGAQLCETSLLLRYGSTFPANAKTMLTHFQQDPIDVSAVESFLQGLSNSDQLALRGQPGIFFMITNSGLSGNDAARLLAAIRSHDPSWNWQVVGSEGRYRTKTEHVNATLPVRFTAGEIRIPLRLNIDVSPNDFELSSGIIEDWNRAIDRVWNNHYRLRNGGRRFALVFAPYMAVGIRSPDATIYVMNRSGRCSASPQSSGLRDLHLYLEGLEPETVAHEFGHMFGNPDEYDLIPADYQAVTGQAPASPPVRGGQTVEGLMGSQYVSTRIEDRHVMPAVEIVNMARDHAVFPDPFVLERI